jgi:putative DNA primase/helicase
MDCLMALDESHSCDAKNFDRVIYNIFGGQGKTALNANRQLKEQRKWRIIIVSSGEISAFQMVEGSGGKSKAGQQVRMLDIPITCDIVKDAASADALKLACSRYYGTAGIAFVQSLMDKFKTADQMQKQIGEAIEAEFLKLPKTDAPEKSRAMKHFALVKVAGIMAVKLIGLPLTTSEVSDSVDTVANAWLNNSSLLPDVERGIVSVRDFIQKHSDSRFKKVNDETQTDERLQVNLLAGFWDIQNRIYYFTPAAFREACGDSDMREVARELKKREMLHTNETDRLNIQFQPKIKMDNDIEKLLTRQRCYAVKASIHSVDPD